MFPAPETSAKHIFYKKSSIFLSKLLSILDKKEIYGNINPLHYFTKEVFTTLYTQIQKEQQKLTRHIKHLEHLISNLPNGNLVCCHHKNKVKWYTSDGHTKTYIPKVNEKLAQQLAIKKYYSYLLEELTVEQTALEAYLSKPHITTPKSLQLLTDIPAYRKLLSSHFKTNDEYISDWINSPYKKNTKHNENLIHKTASGHLVRSKSEALIDLALFTNKIPFRYECALELENITLYPDFTIMHPETLEFFYWEHFGKMDNLSYRQNTGSKLQTYCINNILPNINLITTFESQDLPLNSQQVQEIINYYFK